MERILGWFAATGLMLALIVHGLTFLPLNTAIEEFPVIWVLHLGIFVVFIPFFLAVMKAARSHLIRSWWSVFPWWAIGVIFAAGIYLGANFTTSFVEPSKQGKPEIQNGQFVLVSREKTIHTISEQEYYLRRNYNVRGFSGHWIFFYLIPTLYFWFGVRTQPSNKTSVPLVKRDK
jgi:hypothetical protein